MTPNPLLQSRLDVAAHQIRTHLTEGIIPFWSSHGDDVENGGYSTYWTADGQPGPDLDKYIVTQTRMIWGWARMARFLDDARHLERARRGFEFFTRHFWDAEFGGWVWRTDPSGVVVDAGKVVYGQSFAIYALAEYHLATGDEAALQRAVETFELLQEHCADPERGGYWENFEPDWQRSEPGFCGGDRKSLDIHMHLMEAFTTLAEATGDARHLRALADVQQLICERMVDAENGLAYNQFDGDFTRIPAIDIRRTWNAERATGEVIEQPTDTTSYGHNVELAWLLPEADRVLGQPGAHRELSLKLVDHCLRYGLDEERGGVYRDGPHRGEPLVWDKEWWQNAEVLVGFLEAYLLSGEDRYAEAFLSTWEFDRTHFINPEFGEWRQLLDRDGNVLVGDLGNPWKGIYHTGRAMVESLSRLEWD